MKLLRLLAPLAMLVVGLAAPAPATATEPGREAPLRLESLRGTCTMIGGTYVEDRLASACEISDGAFVCGEYCEYQVTALRDLPPFQEPCVLNRGTFREVGRGQWACDLKDGQITPTCPLENAPATRLLPWRGHEVVMLCGVIVMPSEQPMS